MLFAVIGTWMEADIIEACIRNCYANGCKEVFIIDNDSPDDTVKIAKDTGAIIAEVYKTEFYDDSLRIQKMNTLMRKIIEKFKFPNAWWLALDADEFPCGPNGERLIDYLASLDSIYNTVGAWAADLFPTNDPGYIPNMHPADCMPTGIFRNGEFCPRLHWKHSLLRYTDGNFTSCQSRGLHAPCVQPMRRPPGNIVIEPLMGFCMFHAPYRAKEATFNRLRELNKPKDNGHTRSTIDDRVTRNNGAIKKWHTLERIYAKDWRNVDFAHTHIYGRGITGIALYPWQTIFPGLKTFPRWYELETKNAGRIHLPVL
jgi:glycosyltransferase involved in cell wall biosynthesis